MTVFQRCDSPVPTITNEYKPCLREAGHKGDHNPFSELAPLLEPKKKVPDPRQPDLFGGENNATPGQ
jgi:hypothetical protein